MNRCSDELWTIAVALDCHQDGEPKAVMDRVLQRICDYQTVRRLSLNAVDAYRNGRHGDDRVQDAMDNLMAAATAMDRAYWIPEKRS